jgi:hypothetical protein
VLGQLYDWLLEKQVEGAENPKKACQAETSLIAHSMGAYVLQKAMQLAWTRKNQPLLVSLINRKKRAEFLAFERAFEKLNSGSAWTPIETNPIYQWIQDTRPKLRGNWNPMDGFNAKRQRLALRSRNRVRRALKRIYRQLSK